MFFHRCHVVSVTPRLLATYTTEWPPFNNLSPSASFLNDLFRCVLLTLHEKSSHLYFGQYSHIKGGSSRIHHGITTTTFTKHECVKFVTPQRAHSGEHIELLNRRREALRRSSQIQTWKVDIGKMKSWDPLSEVSIIPTNKSIGDRPKGRRKEEA